MGGSLQDQIARSQRKQERLRRVLLFDQLNRLDIDPVSPEGLNVIDNYDPEWELGDDLGELFGRASITAWMHGHPAGGA